MSNAAQVQATMDEMNVSEITTPAYDINKLRVALSVLAREVTRLESELENMRTQLYGRGDFEP
jgi:hypothetical protein